MKQLPKKISILLFILLPLIALSQNKGRLSGIVVDKSTQQRLPFATVTITGINRSFATDSAGNFRITEIPLNVYTIEISLVGYKKLSFYNIGISAGNEQTLTAELEPDAQQLQGVTIKTNKRTARAATLETPLSVQRLTTEEIKSNPGGNFDISKVIQTLPGVGGGAQGGSFRNDIIIRGGAPNENVFYLDGIEIPVINHFQTQGSSGGPQGILNVSFIEDVKLSSSAFDARYDNAMSSVFQFKQKNGNPN
ncbi:MAG TPA: TonB-dependent receptor, partial [Chitinophagaceae bacterium]|nr:TonB-dependent receptor [Chitinophagaceae bacterium]